MKHWKIFSILTLSILILFFSVDFTHIRCEQALDAGASLFNWMEHTKTTVDIYPGKYKAFYLTVEDPESLICGFIQSDQYFYIDFGVFDELSFYKWKSNKKVSSLVSKQNLNSIEFFFLRVPKPGKYFLVLKSNAALIRQNVSFIFTTPPTAFSIDRTKAFVLSKNCFVYKMGVGGGYMQLVISASKPAYLQSYLNVSKKVLGIKSSKPLNVLVEDEEGVTVTSYQGLIGNKKINIGKEIAILKFTTSSVADIFVTVKLPE